MNVNEVYVICRQRAEYPAAADRWSVLYGDGNEAISHHESEAEARAAINRYKRGDLRRKRAR